MDDTANSPPDTDAILTEALVSTAPDWLRVEDVISVTPDSRGSKRIPPHSVDAEQSVLGAVLLDNEAINPLLEIISEEDFYKKEHRVIFAAMSKLSDERQPIDVVTLTDKLRGLGQLGDCGGVAYISNLVDIVPTAANTQFYARIIREMSIRRSVVHQASEIVSEAFSSRGDIDTFIDSIEQRIFQISDARVNQGFSKIGELVKGSVRTIEEVYVNKGPIGGTQTGFSDLDGLTFGLQPSDLIIVAGRPAMGKTSFAMSIARHVALDQGKPVAVFSLEMSKEQLVTRLICSESRVNNTKVRSGRLSESDFPRIVDAASRLASAELYIDDTPAMSIIELRAKSRRLHREKPLALIVVDYLQLLRGASKKVERREQEISEISRSLKALAKELHVPVMALSQLNRGVEARHDKRPIMADLRESGAIEQDADIIEFVYRDEVYHPESNDKGIAEIIVVKHRNGPVGTVRLAFQAEHTLFVNLEENSYDNYLGADLAPGDELI
jgi:replicative DNA helicase